MYRATLVAACACLVLAADSARASDPVGIYALIERVALEPDAEKPHRVQLWGWFSQAVTGTRNYHPPQRGYMYFEAPAGKLRLCRAEWRDFQELAGTGDCVTFGSRYRAPGNIREPDETPRSPDPYPLDSGLTAIRIGLDDYPPLAALADIPLPIFPADQARVDSGPATLKVINVRTKRQGAKYVFEITEQGSHKREKSDPLPAGDRSTEWRPELELRPGRSYIWRVKAFDGNWESPVIENRFEVEKSP